MFAYTGFNQAQVEKLRESYHIYLTDNGRINVAGLNSNNIDYVAKAFHKVSQD